VVRLHSRDQQTLVGWPMVVHLIVRDDLVLGFLQLHQLAKLIRLAGLAF
jgi:hypothetical protein